MRPPLGVLIALVTASATGRAAPPEDGTLAGVAKPPPINVHYLQSGVSLAAELVPSAGAVCPTEAQAPCILGGGPGLAIRIGYRARRPWFWGGAYEVTRHVSSNLLRLAILQQLRAEGRRYFDFGSRLVPYGLGGVGAAAYGNEFGAETYGLLGTLGIGAEFQLNRAAVVGSALGYRPLFVRRWTDSTGEERGDGPGGFGLAHVMSVEFTVEMRRQLPRW